MNTPLGSIPRIFIKVKLRMKIPSTGDVRETVAILDSGSGVNLVNEDLAHD